VMSVEPGRVAAYSDMLDCVAILGYNPDFLREFALRKGSRLIGVNYYTKGAPDADIVHWPGKCSTWTGFNPMIADFLTDDEDRLDDRKATLNPDFYDRCRELAEVQLKLRPDMRRSGRPIP
ncbi:MAG TPA: hypothetical protein VN641_07300, partial [Urbifossiella sp.]|nr:hypothetical protein [Urbifossiella sp.]